MAPVTFANPTPLSIPGYALGEQLYTGSRIAVYRAVQTAQQRPVVIKVLQRQYPSFSELVQLRNQYTITRNLTIPGVIRPYSLESYGNSYALVMEDFGGVSLGQYAQHQPLEAPIAVLIRIECSLNLRMSLLGQPKFEVYSTQPGNAIVC